MVADNSGWSTSWLASQVGASAATTASTNFAFLNEATMRLVGVISFSDYRGHDVIMAAALTNPACLRRKYLSRIADYVFNQLGCRRISSVVSVKNKRSLKITRNLGFSEEGRIRKAFNEDDAILFGMLREECRWLDPGD